MHLFWSDAKYLILPAGFIGVLLVRYVYDSLAFGLLAGFPLGAILGATAYRILPLDKIIAKDNQSLRAMVATLVMGLALFLFDCAMGKPENGLAFLLMSLVFALPSYSLWRKQRLMKKANDWVS